MPHLENKPCGQCRDSRLVSDTNFKAPSLRASLAQQELCLDSKPGFRALHRPIQMHPAVHSPRLALPLVSCPRLPVPCIGHSFLMLLKGDAGGPLVSKGNSATGGNDFLYGIAGGSPAALCEMQCSAARCRGHASELDELIESPTCLSMLCHAGGIAQTCDSMQDPSVYTGREGSSEGPAGA